MAALASRRIIWQPQPGPQEALLRCPIREICYGGARGGGKTDGMLGRWLAHRQKYGALAQGIFFRRRYKQLDRVRDRGKQLFIPTGARFLSSKDEYRFIWPDGSSLRLRHLQTTDDADEYQGHEYNFMCFEEATQWPNPLPIDRLRAANRDSQGVECLFLLTCNPGGVGHQWVKERYITPNPAGYQPVEIRVPTLGGGREIVREVVYIPAKVWDNRKLLESQPDYIDNLYLSGPEWLVRAWLAGDWDIVAGGYLEGIWAPERHIVEPFMPPMEWPRWRALDWGFAKPFSVGWYAMDPDTSKIFRYRELYGYGGQANMGTREDVPGVKAQILELERHERQAGVEFRRNPADRSIWAKIGTQMGIEELFRKAKVKTSVGDTSEPVKWIKGENTPGSRVVLNALVVATLKHEQFAVTADCRHFLRTVPVIPADEDNPEDVDSDAEDHAWDEFKLSIASRRRNVRPPAAKDKGPTPFSGPWLEGIKNGKYVPPVPVPRQ